MRVLPRRRAASRPAPSASGSTLESGGGAEEGELAKVPLAEVLGRKRQYGAWRTGQDNVHSGSFLIPPPCIALSWASRPVQAHGADRRPRSRPPAARRHLLLAPLRLGAEPPRASARVCNRRRVHAGCWRSRLLRLAGIPARATDHAGRGRKSTRPGANGVVELTPFEFLDRLADLVPRPRKHRHRYHGVFAPNHKLRSAVTAHDKRECRQATRCRDRSACGQRTCGGRRCPRRLLRLMRQTAISRHLSDRLGQTHGPGGRGVSAGVATSNLEETAGRSRLTSNRRFASGRRPGWLRPREVSP